MLEHPSMEQYFVDNTFGEVTICLLRTISRKSQVIFQSLMQGNESEQIDAPQLPQHLASPQNEQLVQEIASLMYRLTYPDNYDDWKSESISRYVMGIDENPDLDRLFDESDHDFREIVNGRMALTSQEVHERLMQIRNALRETFGSSSETKRDTPRKRKKI